MAFQEIWFDFNGAEQGSSGFDDGLHIIPALSNLKIPTIPQHAFYT